LATLAGPAAGTDETLIPEVSLPVSAAERFLDVEFVAIYW
jgi:hypothetical protein